MSSSRNLKYTLTKNSLVFRQLLISLLYRLFELRTRRVPQRKIVWIFFLNISQFYTK